MQDLQDLVSSPEKAVSQMAFKRSLYPLDWKHFLDRFKDELGGLDPARVSEEDFCSGGDLEHLQACAREQIVNAPSPFHSF